MDNPASDGTKTPNDLRDEASLKLSKASAIIDALAVLHCSGDPESLLQHTESTLLLHAGELVTEVKAFINDPKLVEVSHGK